MEAYICDSIMGSGKTSAAINKMRTEPGPFIFVTKFLSEVERVCRECADRHFVQPTPSEQGKIGSLLKLLDMKRNIASTHALFYKYNEEVLEALRAGGYTLILDEVVDAVQPMDVTPGDIKIIMEKGYGSVGENNRVEWVDDEYSGKLTPIKQMVESRYITFDEGKFFIWQLPIELFLPFKEVWVLTYMFEHSTQGAYFKLNNIPYTYVKVHIEDGKYMFVPGRAQNKTKLPNVYVEKSRSLNRVGDSRYALSSTWFKKQLRGDREILDELRRCIYNVMRNKFPGYYGDRMWTTFENARTKLRGEGYSKGFLAYNARATNDYSNRTALAYCVNVFLHPSIKSYFSKRGVPINEDQWALSEMLQWVWRSAVRRGEEIWLYIPSRRMRLLFLDWVREVTSDEGSVAENVR